MAYSPIPPNVISTVNSTTTNLAVGATFTGTSEDVSAYAVVQVSIFASHASATDGLSLQQSSDGTNWDITDVFTVPATTGKVFSVQPGSQFFRLVYTNGATLTTSLRIKTIYHWSVSKPSSQRPQDALSNDNDFEQVSGFLHGFNGTTWDRLRTTGTGVLSVGGSVTATVASTTVTSLVPGVAATSLGKAEDAAHTSGDTGIQMLGVRNDNAATALTSANGDYASVATDITGTLFTRDAPSNTSSIKTPVTAATTSTTVLAANPARRTAIFYNNSTSDCYLAYGATASSTSFTLYVPSFATIAINGQEYAGVLSAIWLSVNGTMNVTETSL